MSNYVIDTKSDTITHIIDPETGEKETMRLSSAIELLFWLRSREDDLRYIVHKALPIESRKQFTLVGGYYVGMTSNRERVKVKAERLQQALTDAERIIRKNWLEMAEERQRIKRGPIEVGIYDQFGRQTNKPEVFTGDCIIVCGNRLS